MKKPLLLALILLGLLRSSAPAQDVSTFTGLYWIMGEVRSESADDPNGRRIYFANGKATDIIGTAGASGQKNRFLINACNAEVTLTFGSKYNVFTDIQGGMGAGPQEITVSGKGYEDAGSLLFFPGGGVEELTKIVSSVTNPPDIKVWFGDRLYHEGLPMYISRQPRIKIECQAVEPSIMDANRDNYKLAVNEATPSMQNADLQSVTMDNKKSMAEFTLPNKLDPGPQNFNFKIKSVGVGGGETEKLLTVTVLGGPLRVVDNPVTYPSPFNPERDHEVTIQYTLSDDANIDLYIYDISAELVKKMYLDRGKEGGSAQTNKVKWNGYTAFNRPLATGIYMGNVVDRNSKKILAKFKLPVYY